MVLTLSKKILIFAVLIFGNVYLALSAMALATRNEKIVSELFLKTQIVSQKGELVLGAETVTEEKDTRVLILEKFLEKHRSPLLPYASRLVEVADKNGLHYGLLPALAMVESTLCRTIPADSYNCWGWGIYGKTVTRFSSYDEAIDTVARGLKRDYYDKGYKTPEEIMLKYNPTNHNNWLQSIKHFLSAFEE